MWSFSLSERAAGKIEVTCGAYRADDERKLARTLVEAGCHDGPIYAHRNGRPAWSHRSLHAFAARALIEGERGFRYAIYQPYPPRPMHPALERAVSACVVEAKNRKERDGPLPLSQTEAQNGPTGL